MRIRLVIPRVPEGYVEEDYPSPRSARERIKELQLMGWDRVHIQSAGKPRIIDEVLDRYPILVAHMICESLGYFTPNAAANALLAHIEGRPLSL